MLRFLVSAGTAHAGISKTLLEHAVDGDELAPADIGKVRALLATAGDIRF
jgi:hypothetical protein